MVTRRSRYMMLVGRALQLLPGSIVTSLSAVFLLSCAGTGQHPTSPVVSVAESKAMPEQAFSPRHFPPRPNTSSIKKIVVPSIKTRPHAIYRRSGPLLDLSMPDFEIPVTGSGGDKKAVWAPGPGNIEKTGTLVPQPLAWSGTEIEFDSAGFDDNISENGGFVFIPPDPHAAAGPNHVVNVVNTMITVHLKDGTFVWRDSLAGFFSILTPLTFTFDPKVLYDQYTGRWVVITMEQDTSPNSSRMFVAVSETDDPTGDWIFSEFNTVVNISSTDHWADYPGFAVDEEAVYITTNLFSFSAGAFGGSRVWILAKGMDTGGFYDGGALAVAELDPYLATSCCATTTQPSHMFGTVSADVGIFLVSFSGLSDGTDEFIQVMRLNNPLGWLDTPPTSPVFTQTFVEIGDIDSVLVALPDMPQAGGGAPSLIESNDRRALDAVWRNNALWLTTTFLPNSEVDNGETTALWVKIDTTSLALGSLLDYGAIGGEDIAIGTYTTFASIAVNVNEDVVVGFSASAPSIFAGAYFVDRQASDDPGIMGSAVTVKAGVDKYTRTFGGSRNRWGDYSATVLDPLDGCFWVYNEWADTRGTRISGELGRWGTAYVKTCSTSNPICNATYHIDANVWTRFALPCSVAPNNTVMDIFGGSNLDDLNPVDYGTNWFVYRRDSSIPEYFLLDITDPMTEGNAYWVYSAAPTQVNLNGSPAAITDIDLFGLPAGRDNYVGHNQNVTVDWNQVQVVEADGNVLDFGEFDIVMSPIMNKWSGNAYQVFDGDDTGGSPGTLDPFDAVWVYVFESGIKLRIPGGAAAAAAASFAPVASSVESRSSTEGQGPDRPKKPKDEVWYIRLIASAGDMEDPGNVLGQRDTATEGNDPHDLEEPAPFGSNYLSILFTNPLFAPVNWGFTTDFRALTKQPQGVWPFVVKAYAGIHEVTIRWEGDDYLFKDAWLVDEQSGEMIKVQAGESYTFEIEGGEHYLRFELGDE